MSPRNTGDAALGPASNGQTSGSGAIWDVQTGPEVQQLRRVAIEEIRTLRANADLDPVQRAQTIALLQRVLLRAEELQRRRVAGAPAGPHFKLAGKEIETLRANPDLDPVQRARTIAQLARLQLRAIELQSRPVEEAQRVPRFDLAAVLEEAWREFQPELERRKREARDAEQAEISAD